MYLRLSLVWIIFWIIFLKEKYGGGGVYVMEILFVIGNIMNEGFELSVFFKI